MNSYNLDRALQIGKIPFVVTKWDGVNLVQERYVLASSLEQCQKKFAGWKVDEISLQTFNSHTSDADSKGWSDGYNDIPNRNPYNKKKQADLWSAYESGYEQGQRDC